MVSNGKKVGERVFPYNINLPADAHWIHVTHEGLAEYISRYRANTSMSNLLSQAIYFCKDKTGDELWDEVGDAFIFSSERRGAISINSEIDQHISDIRDRLIGTSETARDEVRWSNRFVVAAILYVFCSHLIKFRGRRIVMPEAFQVDVPALSR